MQPPVSDEQLEQYYWDVADPASADELVPEYSILYGSDLDCRIVGSGFPQTQDFGRLGVFRDGDVNPAVELDSADGDSSAGKDAGKGPTAMSQYQREVWKLYAADGWNLNNIPLLRESVLQLLPGRIAGISRYV